MAFSPRAIEQTTQDCLALYQELPRDEGLWNTDEYKNKIENDIHEALQKNGEPITFYYILQAVMYKNWTNPVIWKYNGRPGMPRQEQVFQVLISMQDVVATRTDSTQRVWQTRREMPQFSMQSWVSRLGTE